MNIVVTGGAGFIGMNLCNALISAGHSVTCIDNFFSSSARSANRFAEANPTRFRVVRGDVANPQSWIAAGRHDAVYHLACPASPAHYLRDPVFTLETAFGGTMNALSAAREWSCPVLVASVPESSGAADPIGPRSCYNDGKRAAEALAYSAFNQWSTDVRVVRIFNSYGHGMSRTDGRMIPSFVTKALAGEPVVVYGHGLQTRSLCYVDDTVAGLIASMGTGRARSMPVHNIGNPDERTVLSVAEDVIRMCGSKSKVVHLALPKDVSPSRRPDVSAVRRDLGWEPRVSFDEGVHRTIDWFSGSGRSSER